MQNKTSVEALEASIRAYDGPPLRLMEVCGTHTHSISRFGIPALFPPQLSLISGPGCPVCVTPAGYIDRAAELAAQPDTTVLCFGDLMRVPGARTSLAKAKADGGSVRVMYSPMDALTLAKAAPNHRVVVAAVGFETTLPLYALLAERLLAERIENVRMLTSVKALLPALEWIGQNNPDIGGFIGPGHVSAILGYGCYEPLCERMRLPLTIAGFGYEHLIAAISDLIRQARQGKHQVHNLYPSAVTRQGNAAALALIDRFFAPQTSPWRGLGDIAGSAYALRAEYAALDAGSFPAAPDDNAAGCLCGQVIMGRARPVDCTRYGRSCTPENPIGPCMVSSEGTCGIWYANGRTV